MVSSVCRGSYPSMSPHASPSRKQLIDPHKDYFVPLQVETSVEYDLPAHIYPPKDSEPILMIQPSPISQVRARSRAVITPSPTAMVATSGATRPLAPLQISQQQQAQQQLSSSVRSSLSSRSVVPQRTTVCSCGNVNCNSSVKSISNVQNIQNSSARNVQNVLSSRSVQSSRSVVPSSRSVQSVRNSAHRSVQNQNVVGSVQSNRNVNFMEVTTSRSASTLMQQSQPQQLQPQQPLSQQQQQVSWGNGGRCVGPCCNPRAGAIAPLQAEFVAPGLPPSLLARTPTLLARTPTRGTAGGSPKLRSARSRRGMAVASSVNLPDYLGNSRPARITGGAVHAHARPRALSTSMGALVATPAPPMAHQHISGGMSAALTTSLDLARAYPSTPSRASLPVQQVPPSSTSSLLYTVGLSRDSGCSVGAETAGGDWSSERTRGLVDSGFCTPVDLTDDFVTDTLILGAAGWKDSPTSLPSLPPQTTLPSSINSSSLNISNSNASLNLSNSISNINSSSSISSNSSSIMYTSSLLPGSTAGPHSHHYLAQPIWNLVY